jgi:hypothetical protein
MWFIGVYRAVILVNKKYKIKDCGLTNERL